MDLPSFRDHPCSLSGGVNHVREADSVARQLPRMFDPQEDPAGFLRHLTGDPQDPILGIERDPLAAALRTLGAKGISVPDVLEPYQISLPLYFGATSPHATTEIPHWHPEQAEAYVLLDGEAELLAKFRWDDDGWTVRRGKPGDVLIVRPEACHWWRWRSAEGLALVFKAPQRAGVGRFPNGKVTCQFCPHFGRGCVLPAGFPVPLPKVA